MFRRVERVKSMLQWIGEKVPLYGPLMREDMHEVRDEIVKAMVGAGVAAMSGLVFACFLSVAIILSSWNTGFRITTAWIICAAWGGLAIVGLVYAKRAASGPPPFHRMAAALAHHHAELLTIIDTNNGTPRV